MNENINKSLEAIFQNAVNEIISNYNSSGLRATGHFANELYSTVIQNTDNSIIASIIGPSYIFTLEGGRPPRTSSTLSNDFLNNLRTWVQAKGLQFQSQEALERFVKYLKWHINKFGTALYRSGGRNDIYTPVIEGLKKSIPNELKNNYINELKNGINNK